MVDLSLNGRIEDMRSSVEALRDAVDTIKEYKAALEAAKAEKVQLIKWGKLAYQASCEAFDKGIFSAAKVVRTAPDCVVDAPQFTEGSK